jgi:hypothetical protein
MAKSKQQFDIQRNQQSSKKGNNKWWIKPWSF